MKKRGFKFKAFMFLLVAIFSLDIFDGLSVKTEDEQNYSNNNVLVKGDEKVHSETKTENYNQNFVCSNVGENIFEESSKQSLIWLISGFVSLLVVCAVAVSIVSKRKKQTK